MIVFTISYMAALFPTQKAVYQSSTKCSYIIPNLQSRSAPLVVLANALSNLHFLPLQCSLPGLTDISQTSQQDHPGISCCLPLVSDP